MILFLKNRFKNWNKINPCFILLILVIQSCATHHAQYGKNIKEPVLQNAADSSKVVHTFFLVGDAGNADEKKGEQTLELLQKSLKKSDKNSTLLFLGDNIYPNGLPNTDKPEERALAEIKLKKQLEIAKKFKGKTIFIPGNYDWDSGIEGLERQSKFVTEYLNDKKAFLPRLNCGIDELKINQQLTLITIDSQWFLEDWDYITTINDDCNIKTREDFLDELENLLNKNQDKTVILALHHPLMSSGIHGGQFSLEEQLFPFENKIPIPVVGSLINLGRKTSGINPQDIQNKHYTYFVKHIKTLLQSHDNVIVVSGHDHNLQYIDKDNIKQIISGAGSKAEAAKAVYPNDFSYGGNGYAILNIYANGAAKVRFYGNEKNTEKLLFEHSVLNPKYIYKDIYPASYKKTTTASIYPEKLTKKSQFYKFFFGLHYRKYYSTLIEAKTTTLDTLYGGLTLIQDGGDHQSNSLQMIDQNGKDYVMRGLKKSATRFLQSVAFKDRYVAKEFKDTYSEEFLYDSYTTSHPYTPFVVGILSDKINVAHTNPVLYYIPRHKALGDYNLNFGDELYLVEEHPTDSQKGLASFGKPDAIITTENLLKNLHKDEKYTVDESAYIRARLFDMLIGDWDRPSKHWRWGEYKEGEKIIYKPIPRDRDQAFPKYDGALLSLLMNIPALREMRTYKKNFKNVKWLNGVAYPQDIALLKMADEKEWIKQAKYIQENLTDGAIDKAFKNLPIAVQDKTIEEIKQKLKNRKTQLQKCAADYYKVLQKTAVIVGTDKKDKFVITIQSKKKVEVAYYRIKKEGEELVYTKNFTAGKTKNIWIYGLDEEDVFEMNNNQKSAINICLIGGLNHDYYTAKNGKKVTIYDFKSEENTYPVDSKTKIVSSDEYKTNFYDYKKPKYNIFAGMPFIGFNPDDGIKLGLIANYTVFQFKQNPYTQRHTIRANYYFATDGFELIYHGNFPKSIGKWDLDLDAKITGPNFTINYFGYGNETVNEEDIYGMNYNRVRLRTTEVRPAIKKIGRSGSKINFSTSFERIKVEETTGRYINIPGIVNPNVFEYQQFAGATIKYGFENYDTPSLPTLGFGFSLAGSWTMNINETKSNFPTLEAKLNFNHKIDAKGKVVLATILKSKVLLNNNFEFYQGATLGGDYDLRGYRNQRFLGDQSFYQSSDIRWNMGKIRKSLLPMSYGILGGFDYGRVWLDSESSKKWHQSVGGGLWLNGLDVLTARITYFKSTEDKARVTFGLGFGF